jgi:LemA protein
MLAVLVVPIVIVLIVIYIYNSLIVKKNQVFNAFAAIDVMLKQRYDLIPNLVAAVKGYMQHERQVLTEITEMRAKAALPQISNDEKIGLDSKVTKRLGDIMLAVENYPQLKASENFLSLQKEMAELEDQISAARRAYNAAVTDYNNAVEMFPTNIFANMMSYQKKNLFEIPLEQKENIAADKLLKN